MLKCLFSGHQDVPYGIGEGSNLIGSVTYAVVYKCTRCKRKRYEPGYTESEAVTQYLRALEWEEKYVDKIKS